MDEESLASLMPFEDIMDGEVVVARSYEPLSIGVIRQLVALGQKNVEVIDSSEDEILVKSLKKDPAHDEESALKDIYRKLRPGDPPTAAMLARSLSVSSLIRKNTISLVLDVTRSTRNSRSILILTSGSWSEKIFLRLLSIS
jgi:hypothetical protein